MKRCPECRRDYYDDTLLYCLDDGAQLLEGPRSGREPATAILHETAEPGEATTRPQIYETEDGGVKSSGESRRTQSGFEHRATKSVALGLATLIFLTGGFLAYRYFVSGGGGQINSIAVMPFVNASGNADYEYLSDGITETLINSLSQLPNLAVKGRGSVFRYKGQETEPKQIAADLGVQAVLNGRPQARGDSVTLSLDLVETNTGNQIWGELYERKISDIAALQKEIARDVSNKLQAKLSGADQQNLARGHTADPEAYQLYLQGLYQWNKRTIDSATKATALFQKAIDKDPKFALAYVGLANSYIINDRPRDYNEKAKVAATKALEIDPSLGEAHSILGNVAFYYEWDFPRSEAEFKKAIELNPSYPTAYHWYGETLAALGRFEESNAQFARAVELDPVSMAIHTDQGMAYIYARQFDRAIEHLKKLIETDPNFVRTHFYLVDAYQAKGMFPGAIESRKKGLLLDGMKPELAEMIYRRSLEGYKNAGADGYWKAELELDIERAKRLGEPVDVIEMAIDHANLGDADKAFEFLEKGFRDRRVILVFLKNDYVWDKIRSDPRFADLVRRVGQPN